MNLRNVDRESLEILNGGPLVKPPKESLTVAFRPRQKAYSGKGRISVGFAITNVGEIPITYFWCTAGDGRIRCRDRQLSFKAVLNGVAVAENPAPLTDGFISRPHTAQPNTALRQIVDLTEWLHFGKPGKYAVEATYSVEIMNPKRNSSPDRWTVNYHNTFTIEIED